jgi:glucarate dehydratase
VVEVSTDDGLSGLGETYADERHLAALYAAADAIVGADAYHTGAWSVSTGSPRSS